ncbi:MAG: RNA-directed DNA polymerase, partial [Synechococcales cyanobacterium RM1_1_8]|nr:RNA-directed DNA polymerase [Synechococcales cyanobacterium RM1_1_8]
MLNTDRFREREDQLAQALEVNAVEALWQRYVRNNLRKQPIKDLHDYYDFHLNRRERISITVTSILNGVYQPRQALRLRSEKQNGIARQLVILCPEDALILEALCEHLSSTIRECQPSQNAFYSRNLPQPRSIRDIDETFGYAWWELWPEFQDRILNFAQNHAFLAITDVANYYDSIDFVQLRNYIASLGHFSEVYLDFLFFTIERFVWRPDYLPYPGRGLPQIQLDAPRLLAHAFLFEIDRCLVQNTNDQFVRWMDDVDFGCDSKEQAKSILQNIDDLLLSRGLHLNSSKTKILSGEEACNHFQLSENRFLNVFSNRLTRLLETNRFSRIQERKRLRRKFRAFISKDLAGQWGKVVKRYFTLFGKLEDPYLEGLSIEYLHEIPSLRSNIFKYFIQIGWTETREQILIEFIQETVDDDSFFGAIDVLLAWVPISTVKYTIRMR